MRNHRSPADVTGVLSVFSLLAEAYRFLPWERSASPAAPTAAPAEPTTPRPTFAERLDRWFWRQQRRDVEAYLARSHDAVDLE
jgi:hypothetical protein